MNVDRQTKPGMTGIENFPMLRHMGVLSSRSTTKCGRIRASVIGRRRRSPPNWRDQRPVMQRAGTLRYLGPPRPGPLRQRLVWSNSSEESISQVKTGPKKPGRSLGGDLSAIEVAHDLCKIVRRLYQPNTATAHLIVMPRGGVKFSADGPTVLVCHHWACE